MELQALLIVSLCYFVGHTESKSCYAQENRPYKLFASKTVYDEARGYTVRKTELSGCTPKQFYFLSRHGTRYPKAEDIKRMKERLPVIRDEVLVSHANKNGKLCELDLENLESWKLNINETSDEMLAVTGEQEFKALGTRFKTRFPSLFDSQYSTETADIRTTDTERAQSSAKHFLSSLYGDEANTIPLVHDMNLLRFYKSCQSWKVNVNKNPDAIDEAIKFKASSKMGEVLKEVSKRIGLKNKLTLSDINLMYDMCRFEAAWDQDKISPWCAAFKPDDLKVLEYAEDIKYYYKHGYGHGVNYEQACPPVKDVVDHFKAKMTNGSSEPSLLFRFSHSGMMLKVLSRLGLFKDAMPLTSENYKKQKDRSWRTSLIDSFATNLAFVLWECESDEYKVSTFFQEREIFLPFCTDSPCSIKEFFGTYEKLANNCNVNEICKLK